MNDLVSHFDLASPEEVAQLRGVVLGTLAGVMNRSKGAGGSPIAKLARVTRNEPANIGRARVDLGECAPGSRPAAVGESKPHRGREFLDVQTLSPTRGRRRAPTPRVRLPAELPH
jgi:hypothetical protein